MDEFKNAVDIPEEWDDLTGSNIYLKKSFLAFMENVNPCKQRY